MYPLRHGGFSVTRGGTLPLFLSGLPLQPRDQVSVAVLQLGHFTATFIVARQVQNSL